MLSCAYIPGSSTRPGFGTSTSASSVRVLGSTAPAVRTMVPRNDRFPRFATIRSAANPGRIEATYGCGTLIYTRMVSVCATLYRLAAETAVAEADCDPPAVSGSDDAPPAVINAPYSTFRAVTIPPNGALIWAYCNIDISPRRFASAAWTLAVAASYACCII